MRLKLSTLPIPLLLLFAFIPGAYAANCVPPVATCTDCNTEMGQVGVPYRTDLYGRGIGEYSDFKYKSMTGAVPPGMRVYITPETGHTNCGSQPRRLYLEGTPTQAGVYTFCYQFSDIRACDAVDYVPGGNFFDGCVNRKIEIASCAGASAPPTNAEVKIISIPLGTGLNVTIPICKNCPKDPGAAGNTTVAGISTAMPGVRDDVFRGIIMAYPNNLRARNAALQEARYWQTILNNPTDINIVKDGNDKIIAYGRCLHGALGVSDNHDEVVRTLTLSTEDRSLAYITSENTMSGHNGITYIDDPAFNVVCP